MEDSQITLVVRQTFVRDPVHHLSNVSAGLNVAVNLQCIAPLGGSWYHFGHYSVQGILFLWLWHRWAHQRLWHYLVESVTISVFQLIPAAVYLQQESFRCQRQPQYCNRSTAAQSNASLLATTNSFFTQLLEDSYASSRQSEWLFGTFLKELTYLYHLESRYIFDIRMDFGAQHMRWKECCVASQSNGSTHQFASEHSCFLTLAQIRLALVCDLHTKSQCLCGKFLAMAETSSKFPHCWPRHWGQHQHLPSNVLLGCTVAYISGGSHLRNQ